MKNLILKDIIMMKQIVKVILFFILVWVGVSVFIKSMEFVAGLSVMLVIFIPINIISFDEKSKWNKYALTMPVSPKDIVVSKYVEGIGIGFIGAVLGIVVGLILRADPITLLISWAANFGVGILMQSILFPLIFKYGVEKSRMIFIALIILPMVIGALMPKLGMHMPSAGAIKLMLAFSPVVISSIAVLSGALSVRIMKSKEF